MSETRACVFRAWWQTIKRTQLAIFPFRVSFSRTSSYLVSTRADLKACTTPRKQSKTDSKTDEKLNSKQDSKTDSKMDNKSNLRRERAVSKTMAVIGAFEDASKYLLQRMLPSMSSYWYENNDRSEGHSPRQAKQLGHFPSCRGGWTRGSDGLTFFNLIKMPSANLKLLVGHKWEEYRWRMGLWLVDVWWTSWVYRNLFRNLFGRSLLKCMDESVLAEVSFHECAIEEGCWTQSRDNEYLLTGYR